MSMKAHAGLNLPLPRISDEESLDRMATIP